MEALFSGAVSFILFHFASHPKSRINKRLPSKKIANRVQIFPRVTIEAKNRVFHFHHWMLFSSLYIVFQRFDFGFLHSDILTGFLFGGIIQGLLFADRFKLVFHANEHHKVRKSTYNVSFLKKLI